MKNLSALLAFIAIGVAAAPPTPTEKMFFIYRNSDGFPTDAELSGAGIKSSRDYEGFLLVRLEKTSKDKLIALLTQRAGINYVDVEEFYLVYLDGTATDIRQLKPEVSAGTGAGLHLAQLDGPATKAMQEALLQAGAQIVVYVPNNAYLLVGTPSAVQQIAGLPFVHWTSPFKAEYKSRPPGRAAQASAGSYRVVAPHTPEGLALAAELQPFGLDNAGIEAEPPYIFYDVRLNDRDLGSLLEHPLVIAVAEKGEYRPSGEREALGIILGSFQPNTYRTWLGSYAETASQVIAIADSGFAGAQNSGTAGLHPDFSATGKVSGWISYDSTEVAGSPGYADDFDGHGTAVASIAMGDPFDGSGKITRDSEGVLVRAWCGTEVTNIRSESLCFGLC